MELKSSIDAKNDLREKRFSELEDRNAMLEELLKRAESRAQEEEARARIADRDRAEAVEATMAARAQAEQDVAQLKEVVEKHKGTIAQLQTRLKNMDKSSMEKDAELVRVAELEGKLLALKSGHAKEVQKVQKLNALKVKELEKEVGLGRWRMMSLLWCVLFCSVRFCSVLFCSAPLPPHTNRHDAPNRSHSSVGTRRGQPSWRRS